MIHQAFREHIARRVAALPLALASIFAIYTPASAAMSFHADPPYLFMGGPVVRSDWDAWQEAMSKFNGKLEFVVLHQSGGGDSLAGRKIGDDIRNRSLKTVVLGRCSSACANMFLAGVSREFAVPAKSGQTVLGYHGSYSKTTGKLNTNRTGDYFLRMTDGKMSEDFVERFIRIENKNGLMRFVHPTQRASNSQPLAMLCKGDEERAKRDDQCEKLDGVDALTKGIVTTWDTRVIPTPPSPTKEKLTEKSWAADDARPAFVLESPG